MEGANGGVSSPSDNLAKIPDQISVSFLPDHSDLSQKVLEKGLNYFIQGFVHDIKICQAPNTGASAPSGTRVDAKCWQSVKKKRRSAQTTSRNQRQQDIRSRVYLQSWVG